MGTIRVPPTATPGKEPAALHCTLARKAFHAERSDCKINVLPSPPRSPLSGADGPQPRTPALIPTTESKTSHMAEPGAGDPKQMPSVDIRPHGLKGSQGKLPPKLEGGGMAATHSTKCWHLHPQPGRLLTGS